MSIKSIPDARGATVRQRARRGRPEHAPTEKSRLQVERMAGFGLTEEQIALVMEMTPPTLRKHYRLELDNGHVKTNLAVVTNLFRQATKDDPRSFNAMKFWLNCRAGWSEYAPPPAERPPKPAKIGKKAEAEIAAETAAQGTGWSDLVH